MHHLKSQLHHEYPDVSTSSLEEAIVKAAESAAHPADLRTKAKEILDRTVR